MSEQMPERAPSGGGGAKGLFTEKIGPLAMWVWLLIIAGVLIGWRVLAARKSAAAASSTDAGAMADTADIPQFVNQTYVTTTPPVQGPPGPPGPVGQPGPKPPPSQLTRTWTAPVGGVSDLAEIAHRLTGRSDPGLLHPANKIAANFINGPYKKNRSAKVPKGATFTYTEGTVTPKPGTVPTVK